MGRRTNRNKQWKDPNAASADKPSSENESWKSVGSSGSKSSDVKSTNYFASKESNYRKKRHHNPPKVHTYRNCQTNHVGRDYQSPFYDRDDMGWHYQSPFYHRDDMGRDYQSPLYDRDDVGRDYQSPFYHRDHVGRDFQSPFYDCDDSGDLETTRSQTEESDMETIQTAGYRQLTSRTDNNRFQSNNDRFPHF